MRKKNVRPFKNVCKCNQHTCTFDYHFLSITPIYCSIQMYRWQDQGELPALPFGSLTLITLHR